MLIYSTFTFENIVRSFANYKHYNKLYYNINCLAQENKEYFDY